VIPPGGSGKLVAKVHTQGYSGQRSKNVVIETNDPSHAQVNLVFSFNVTTPVQLLPTALVNLYGVQGEPIKQTVVVRRPDGKPVHVKDVTGAPPDVIVTKEVVTEKNADPPTSTVPARPGDVRLVFSVAQTDKPRTATAQLKITTDHPERPLLTASLTLNIQPPLRITPPRLQLRRDAAALGAVARVNLAHSASRPFRIKELSTKGDLPGCVVRIASDSAGPLQSIEIKSEGPAPAPGIYNGTVVATTDLPAAPSVDIPVTLRVVAAPADTPTAQSPASPTPRPAPAPGAPTPGK